jgi:hypothetical protein
MPELRHQLGGGRSSALWQACVALAAAAQSAPLEGRRHLLLFRRGSGTGRSTALEGAD